MYVTKYVMVDEFKLLMSKWDKNNYSGNIM